MTEGSALKFAVAAAALILPALTMNALAGEFTARDITVKFHEATAAAPVNLAGKDLSNLDLAGLDFKSAILSKANLYGADLSAAIVQDAAVT